MLESLLWMFKIENFKQHILYLIKVLLIICLIAFALGTLSLFIEKNIWTEVSAIIAVILPFFVILCFQGYFWELTECIINRKTDIISADIYKKNKVNQIEIIELPELNFKKFVWRGFASIVASLLLIYPIILLIIGSIFTSGETFNLFNISTSGITNTYIGLYIFIGLFIPALLWNYARRNSIFAVWNLPKAIHIMGTYPIKYFFNTFLFLIFIAIQNCISIALSALLTITPDSFNLFGSDILLTAKIMLYFISASLLYIYWMYVNAYLLGTMVPANEA